MDNYDKLKIAIRYWLIGAGYNTATQAMDFAEGYHTGKRKDGSPEFAHQIQIANYIRTIASSLLKPEATIATAFLHDVVEDYSVSVSDIEKFFGEEIAHAVSKVTKLDSYGNKKDQTRLFQDMSNCPIASVVKGADRIHNFSTMNGAFSYKKQEEYVAEAEALIIPMLKAARRKFVQQEPVYENIKFMMTNQITSTKNLLETVSNYQSPTAS